jgi:PAS domain S-box-containing protein
MKGKPTFQKDYQEKLAARRREIERLKESEALYREMVEHTQDLITRVDGRGCLLYVNHVAEKIFGCPLKQCIGKSAFDYIHPEDRDASRAAFDGWISDRLTNLTFENRMINQVTGEIFDMQCTVNLRYDAQGRLTGVNSIARDLTKRKRAEKALTQLTHNLQERVKELNCLYEISRLRERHDFSLDEILQEIVDIIPASLQFPEIACAQLEFESYAHKTPGFRSTPWKLSRDILIHNEKVCTLEVFYLEEKPEWNDEPFLQEEKVLIDVIAERIGDIIEREWDEIELRRHREHLEKLLNVRTAELVEFEEKLQMEIRRRHAAEEALLKTEDEV